MSELNDILRKVTALLAQADHPNTGPEESETFRAKAEALMFKYRIDESQLSAAERAAMGVSVQWLEMDVCPTSSEYMQTYYDLLRFICQHMEVRHDFIRTVERKKGDILWADQRSDGVERWYTVSIVGFESDLMFVQAMFNAARLAFGSAMEPKYDPTKSEQENAYIMRSAGMEGWRIARAIYGRDDKSLRPKVRKMFADEAKRRGEDPSVLLGKGSNMKLFRESYAQGFRNEYRYRLTVMRAARGATEHGLVLAGRKDMIDEAFYERFPERRPQPVPALGEADIKKCPKCEKAKSGFCRDHSWMRPSRARHQVRYADEAGIARGRAAAARVDMGTGKEIGS